MNSGLLSRNMWVQIPSGVLYADVVEWFKATVLKTADSQGSVGSNPTICATVGKPLSFHIYADMAELADALVLGSSVHDVQVRLLLSAPN